MNELKKQVRIRKSYWDKIRLPYKKINKMNTIELKNYKTYIFKFFTNHKTLFNYDEFHEVKSIYNYVVYRINNFSEDKNE